LEQARDQTRPATGETPVQLREVLDVGAAPEECRAASDNLPTPRTRDTVKARSTDPKDHSGFRRRD